MNVVTACVLLYVALQLAVGAWVSRRVRTEADYLVAGRRLGYGLSIFTIFATWFGAETCIGSAGEVYSRGLAGATADPFGYSVCLLLMGLVFAVPLYRLRLTTVADFFRLRYSRGVERFAALLLVPTSLLWGAAQIRAFGQVLATSSGFDVLLTTTIAAGVVIVYTTSGGLLADAWTDLIQGIALIAGIGVLFAAVLGRHGVDLFTGIDPERLRLVGGEMGRLERIEAWAVPILGSALAGELVSRVIAARSPQVARRSALVAAAVYFVVGLVPVVLGLVGVRLLPALDDPEQLLPRLAQAYLPPLGYAVFAGALVSAILSTVDSTLLVASSLVAHNIVAPLRPGLDDRGRLRVARVGVVVFGLLAYVMALRAESVFGLVEEASAFGSAGVFVVIVVGLFSRWGGARSAFAALVLGVGSYVLGAHVLELSCPYLVSLAVALAGYAFTAALIDARRPAGAAAPESV